MQADFGGDGTVLERLDARTLLEFCGVTDGTGGLRVFGRTGTRCNGWSLLSLKTKLLHQCYTKRYKLNRLTRDTFYTIQNNQTLVLYLYLTIATLSI